ncbi:MAG: DNA primase, partial [Cyanobacteria bacterium P01_H01_bin.150]
DCNQSSSPSEKSQSNQEKMVEVWDNQYELGKLVLEIPENELTFITANYTNVQIKHIKDAANRAWQVGLNRDAEYNGERVEIMEARSCSREVKVRTQSGSLLKVKRGNLQPWLGI